MIIVKSSLKSNMQWKRKLLWKCFHNGGAIFSWIISLIILPLSATCYLEATTNHTVAGSNQPFVLLICTADLGYRKFAYLKWKHGGKSLVYCTGTQTCIYEGSEQVNNYNWTIFIRQDEVNSVLTILDTSSSDDGGEFNCIIGTGSGELHCTNRISVSGG